MIVNRLLLSTVLPAVTKTDTRYFLDAIELTNGGPSVTAVATNGHVLIKATAPIAAMPYDEYPKVGPELDQIHRALVPSGIAADMIKATKHGRRSTAPPILAGTKIGTDQAGKVIGVTSDLDNTRTFDLSPRDGEKRSFPQWDRVVASAEKRPAVVTTVIGLDVLDALIKAARAGEAKGIKFEIPANDPKRGATIDAIRASWTVAAAPEITAGAVLMPMIP